MSRNVFFTIAFLFISLNLISQNLPDSIALNNLEEAWRLAEKNNSLIKVYQLNIEKANRDHKTSTSYLLPTISGGFTGQDNWNLPITPVPGELVGKPGTTYNAQFGKQFTYNAGITISKSVFDWQSSLLVAAAKTNIELKNAEAQAYNQLLKQQIGQYYFAALLGHSVLLLTKQDLQKADSVRQLAQQRLTEGLIDAPTQNQASINYNNVNESYYQSVQLFQQSAQNLKLLLGLSSEATISFTERITIEQLNSLPSIELLEDKNLYPYKWQIQSAKLTEKIAKAAFVPRLNLSTYIGKQQFRSDFGLSFDNGSWNNYKYVGLNLTVPLFSGFGNHNKLKSSQISSKIAQEQFNYAQQQSSHNDKIIVTNLSCGISITKSAWDNFMLYKSNFSISELKYREGLISMDGYLKSMEDYLKAENNYLNNLASVYANYAIILSRNLH